MEESTNSERSVVVADDHAVVRRGLRTIIEAQPGFTIVAESADGIEAVRQVRERQPDMLVLDLVMPGLHGFDVITESRKCSPNTAIMVLSISDDPVAVARALRRGATSYVLKSSPETELIEGLRATAAGHRFVSPYFSPQLLEEVLSSARTDRLDRYKSLTSREREVLHLVVEGMTNLQIAERLGISARTTETHRANVMQKLNVDSLSELVLFAVRRGIIA